MLKLATRSPPQVHPEEWMTPLPPASRFILHGDSLARTAASPVWGAAFSEEPCRAVLRGSRATLWLGPGEYLLLDLTAEPAGATIAALESALGNIPHALVDISHRQFALAISGPHAQVMLNGACPLDLDIAEFPIGMCTRTVLAKADITLWRTHADGFHLEVWRSFGGYVTGLLREIAGEFYG